MTQGQHLGERVAGSGGSDHRLDHELSVARRLHPGRWIATAAVLLIGIAFVQTMAGNDNLQWDVVGEYFTSESILRGVAKTIQLTAIAMVLGLTIGSIVALMRLSTVPIVSFAGWLFVWFFRGTPLLVQIILWFNLALLFPRLHIEIPFGPTLYDADMNDVMTPFIAAVVALSLCEAAYDSEIVRGGLQSIDAGQHEASRSIGLTRMQTMRYIIFPQAMRVIVPPFGNQVIGMLKYSSLVSVIAIPELLYSAQVIYARTYAVVPLLIVASIWYLIISTVLSIGQYYIERHYAKGAARALPPTPVERIRRNIAKITGWRSIDPNSKAHDETAVDGKDVGR